MTSSDLPRLALALAASAFFVRDVIAKARAARARGSADWSTSAKAALSIVVVSATCWIAVCLVIRAPDLLLWPGLVLTSAAGLGYLGVAIHARRQGRGSVAIPLTRSTEDAADAATERRLFIFVIAGLGVSGALVGLRLGLWWLALPMMFLVLGGWAILVVQEVRRGWQKE
jgi:hypothetical protein